MDTNFNAALYQEEMLSLVNTAIKKLKAEHPDYTVFTISLTTDFASGVSAVHFDSRASSERYLKNEAEQYQKYLQAGNLSMAEMYAPTGEIRITNPADFELPFYAEIQNESFSLNFEEEQEDEDSELEDEASCVYWEEATPILKQVAAVAYRTAKSELNVDSRCFIFRRITMNRVLRIDEEKPEMHISVQGYKVTLCFAEKENPEVAVLVKQALLSAYAMPQK